jgi:dolichol kinase
MTEFRTGLTTPSDSATDSGRPQPASQSAQEPLHESATIDYTSEIIRKGIHVCSLSIPTIYFFITKELALSILVPITAAFLITDIARFYIRPVARWFYRWFGWMLRQHERDDRRKRLNGASNVLIAATVCVLVFPKIIAITALAILIISDSTSALVGRRFGKRRFLAKSLEGAIAFFVSAVIVVLVTPKIEGWTSEYLIGIVAAVVGTFVESISVKVDDNISIPISIGAIMWGLYAALLPSVDLYRPF